MHPHNAMHPLKPKGVHCIKIRVISHVRKSGSQGAGFQTVDVTPDETFGVSRLRHAVWDCFLRKKSLDRITPCFHILSSGVFCFPVDAACAPSFWYRLSASFH